MTARKEKSNSTFYLFTYFATFQNTAFLLINIQVWVDFLRADMTKKVTSKLNTSVLNVSTTFTESEKAKIKSFH